MSKKAFSAFQRGRCNAARQHTESPLVKERPAQPGVLYCKGCKAQHHDKRWYAPDEAKQFPESMEMHETLCPGCYSVENHICNGEVVLRGPKLDAMRTTVHYLIANIEKKCWHDNPKSRILSFNDLGETIYVTTTTEWLALRIGKEVRKALKGNLNIRRFPEESFARVQWTSPQA